MDAIWKRSLALLALSMLGPVAGAKEPLRQPLGVRGVEPSLQIRHAFEIDPRSVVRPPHSDPEVKQASTNPNTRRSQTLLALFAEAERLAGRARPVSDLTDLIERCREATNGLGKQESPGLRRLTSWAYNRRGELRVAAGDPRDAFADFQRAILLDQKNDAAYLNRGVTLAQYGKTAEAHRDFCSAISLAPTHATAYHNRAELRLEREDFAGAESDFTAALAHGDPAAILYTGRGFAYANLGKAAPAVQDYTEALRLAPGDCETLVLRGSLYAETGYYQHAITDFSNALRTDPTSSPAYRGAAWLLSTCPDERFRDPQKALEAARRAERYGQQDDPLVKDVLAAAYASDGQYADAVRYQQQAVQTAPADHKQELQTRLDLYRQGRPYVQPPARVAAKADSPRR